MYTLVSCSVVVVVVIEEEQPQFQREVENFGRKLLCGLVNPGTNHTSDIM